VNLLLVLLLVVQAKPAPPRRTALNLFASLRAIGANRVLCGVDNVGQICEWSVLGDGPIQGGAFWPRGTPDQYIFSSGLQVAALIPAGAGFAWAGDTTGAYFWDARGDQTAGTARSAIFNSLDTNDVANWPPGGIIRDGATFDPRLIGRSAASEQDLWTRYWDGDPSSRNGRAHQMGVLVDQRVLAWNYPTGNQDIVYVVLTLYNVTARTASAYANPTIPAELQSEIAAVGRVFQDSIEGALGVSIPDGGFAFDSMYVQLGMDHDVAAFNRNYGTASVPFGMGIGYTGTFLPEIGWMLPPDPFGAPPFAAAPGLLGTRFLKTPAPFAMFTNTTGGGTFPDPVGVALLWRRMSGNLLPTDTQCSFTDPAVARARHVCYLAQTQTDSRYQMSTGPLSLAPGEATTLVLAYIFAPPLDTANAYLGGDLKPGLPFTGDSIALDTTKVQVIERIAGWRAQSDLNGSGAIEAGEVIAARRSLMHKAQVAQAIVDAKFLMPQPPDAPDFFLIPGDNEVTVVWQPSATEQTGDPYFPLAADRSSPLFDPNFREFDVEGYRIYRGTDPRALQLIAQFDHDLTTFVDYVGAVAYPGQCAPELGVLTDCPVAFPPAPDTTASVRERVFGRIIQVPEGGRILSSNGLVTTVTADTFPHARFEPPFETGVTFAFTDSTVKNSFRYYYAVTAYDFNSIRSGPSSFESPRFTKLITPRVSSGQEVAGMVQAMSLVGGDGTILDTAAPLPTVDPASGIFSGPMPPANGIALEFSAFVPELLAAGAITVTIDSLATGMGILDVLPGAERPTLYYVTSASPGLTTRFTIPLQTKGTSFVGGSPDASALARFGAVLVDSAQAARFGAAPANQLFGQVTLTVPNAFELTSWGRADVTEFPAFNSSFNGPRWWVGANENTPNPNGGVCAPSILSCGNTFRVPNIAGSAGAIPGVTIFHPQSYNTIPNTPGRISEAALASVTRAADFRVYWGGAGIVDSVVDVTHRVRVPFSAKAGPSWGILTEESFAGVNQALTGDTRNTLLTWSDLFCVEPLPAYTLQCGAAAQTPAILQNSATLRSIAVRDTASSYAGTADPAYTATGTGFVFYLNGHFFLMQLAALPPAGTVWNARFYAGTVTGSAAQANFAFEPAIRPPAVPGLRARINFQGSQLNAFATTDSLLNLIHTVPDPFYLMSGYEVSPDTLQLKFVHLPAAAIVRIYSLSGILVHVLTNNDPTGGGELTWNLKNRNGLRVASGVYFYHVETMDHRHKVGRFTVVAGRPNQ
jgi:hypothetical protein